MTGRRLSAHFKTADFWAREFRSPLFWFTHRQGGRFRDKTLVFRKGQIMHLYHLDDRVERGAEAGYRFFVSGRGLARYRRMVKETREAMGKDLAALGATDLKNLTDARFAVCYESAMAMMHSYLRVYVMTEEHRLAKIGADRRHKKMLAELGEMRLRLRKEGEKLFTFLLGKLAKEAARRHGLKVADILLYTDEEMTALLREGRKARADAMRLRKRGYALITINGKQTLLTGLRFRELYKKIVLTKRVGILYGRTAMGGRARGPARLLRHDRRDLSKRVAAFKPGEILVTEMTRPDTVLACRKAAAIVTDEGGIACHAAIISRELGIPCVVGTKDATRSIKDGDIIEVNADDGIVTAG